MDDADRVRVTLERRWPIGTHVRVRQFVRTLVNSRQVGEVISHDDSWGGPRGWDHRVRFDHGGASMYAFDELELIDGDG